MALESIHAFLKRKRDDGETRKRKEAPVEAGALKALGLKPPKTCEVALGEEKRRVEELEAELEQARIREAVYKKLIERYADVIEAGEEKTIPELRALINPEDETVRETKARILDEFPKYDFDKHFLRFADKAFEFIASLRPVHSGVRVSYWLSPREVIELGAADAFDKAVFLCSLLRAGGNTSARVRVIELEGGIQHPVVVFEFHGRVFLFDAEAKIRQSATSAEALFAKVCCGGKRATRLLYEFNDQNYEEFNGEA
ncbi:MAG: hypothetical protein QW343_00465 [Candidatus Norongarragalinales archaeon]